MTTCGKPPVVVAIEGASVAPSFSPEHLLLAKRTELLALLGKLGGGLAITDTAEQMEASVNLASRNVTAMQVRIAQGDLVKVNIALARLKHGSWHECMVCGEDISEKRHIARPEATDCVRCAGKGGGEPKVGS